MEVLAVHLLVGRVLKEDHTSSVDGMYFEEKYTHNI